MKSSTAIKITKADVVEKAREYLGTPFAHQGRVKGHAMDCVGILLCVGNALGLKDKLGVPILKDDNKNYSAQPLNNFVHEECQRRLIEKPITAMQEGYAITMQAGSAFACHAGIVSENGGALYVIHAYNGGARKVVEHIVDEKWMSRIVGVFSFPGVG